MHWSTVGAATAPDSEILTWTNEHEFVPITNDLDFSAILAAGAAVEERVLIALREKLMRRDLFEDFGREYVRKLNRIFAWNIAWGLASAGTELARVEHPQARSGD